MAALLFWIIGNELNLEYSNPRVFDAVEDVARMIHELDPDHPASMAIAGFEDEVIAEIQARAPSLDFISIQVYGSLFTLPQRIESLGFNAPFMITEWVTVGHWEVARTEWGALIEVTSSQKADLYRRAFREILDPLQRQLLGSYAFYWAQKQERTPTWFGLLTETGERTEAVDVLHHRRAGDRGRSPPRSGQLSNRVVRLSKRRLQLPQGAGDSTQLFRCPGGPGRQVAPDYAGPTGVPGMAAHDVHMELRDHVADRHDVDFLRSERLFQVPRHGVDFFVESPPAGCWQFMELGRAVSHLGHEDQPRQAGVAMEQGVTQSEAADVVAVFKEARMNFESGHSTASGTTLILPVLEEAKRQFVAMLTPCEKANLPIGG